MSAAAQATETLETITGPILERLKAQRMKHLHDSGETTTKTEYKCQKCRDTGYYEIEKTDIHFHMNVSAGKCSGIGWLVG